MYYLNGGVGELEALRKPLRVNRATYERAQANLAFQPMGDRIDPTKRMIWARTHTGLDVPFWRAHEYKDKDPMAAKSGLIYQPYWMTNRSRGRLIQRPYLQVKPRSEVLYHLGTDEDTGLGKGFNPGKALKRAVHITPTSFQPKKIFGAIGSVTAGVFTAGLGPALAPKLFSANSSTMKSLGMGVVAIVAVAGAVVMAPAIAAALGPTFSSGAALAGKAVTGMQTFMTAWKKLSPSKAQQMSSELTPQQIADIENGKANLTEQGVDYNVGQPPGSLMVQGQPVPLGTDPRYNPNAPAPLTDASYGASPGQDGSGSPATAGLIGGLSPLMIGLMIGVPLAMQLVFKGKGK